MSEDEKRSRPAFSAPLLCRIPTRRQGISQILKAFPDGIQLIEEPGTLGNPTAQMISEEIGTLKGYNRMLEKYADRESERDSPDRGMER